MKSSSIPGGCGGVPLELCYSTLSAICYSKTAVTEITIKLTPQTQGRGLRPSPALVNLTARPATGWGHWVMVMWGWGAFTCLLGPLCTLNKLIAQPWNPLSPYTHTSTCTHTHTRTHRHAHTHTHTQTHLYSKQDCVPAMI